MIFEHVILLLWSSILSFFQFMLAVPAAKKNKKQMKISLAQVRSPVGPHLISYRPAHQWPSWNLGLYFDKCCSESDSLGDLETTEGQIESVSQTFVSSIINAPLLFSLWSFQSIFYQSHFFLSANITGVCSCFSVSFIISCFLFDVFSGHADFSDLTCDHFISFCPYLSGFPFSDHILTFRLLVPSGFPSFSSFLLLCLGWFFLRSNIS